MAMIGTVKLKRYSGDWVQWSSAALSRKRVRARRDDPGRTESAAASCEQSPYLPGSVLRGAGGGSICDAERSGHLPA